MSLSWLRTAPMLMLALASCSTQVDMGAERALLEEADRRYVETANAGDVEGLVALYADDATRFSPSGESSSGPAAMRAFAEGVASIPGFHLEPTLIAMEVSGSGDLAYTLNELELTTTDDDGAPSIQRLRDLHTWRREVDGWKIVVDLWQVLP